MIQNTFYATIQRRNMLRDRILDFFLAIASYPRLLLEVFIRKDFGHRYFRLISAITLAVILYFIPDIHSWLSQLEPRKLVRNDPFLEAATSHAKPMSAYLTWYIFIAAFVGFSIKHFLVMRKSPSPIEAKKYSLYTGTINPIFYKINIPGVKTDTRIIEQFLEPLVFFITGVILWLMGQHLGMLLIVCSVIYCVSYIGIYIAGDNMVMDMIDKIIINQEMKKSFVENRPKDETRGFEFIGRKPVDADMREKLLNIMMGEEEVVEVK